MTYAGALVILIVVGGLFGYLSGSVLWAVCIGKWCAHKDVREYESKNPGFTNSTRVLGRKLGLVVLVLDVFKTIIPTLVMFIVYWCGLKNTLDPHVTSTFNPAIFLYTAGFFAVIGHLFPIYYKFKGGKGIASLGGLLLAISPFMGITAGLIIIICVLITEYVSLGAIIAVLVAPFLSLIPGINYTYFMYPDIVTSVHVAIHNTCIYLPIFGALLFLGILIVYKHKSNIRNLLNHNERKFDYHRRTRIITKDKYQPEPAKKVVDDQPVKPN